MNFKWLDRDGTFRLDNAEEIPLCYFPLAAEGGVMASITPMLKGDLKQGQNSFVLPPASEEDLRSGMNSRNFWCRASDGTVWSATGGSAKQVAEQYTKREESCSVEAGLLWHSVIRQNRMLSLEARIYNWIPYDARQMEVMRVVLRNTGTRSISFTPTAAIPLYGRSADNLRDHRHVTALLHRAKVRNNGVLLTPTYSFDERGHQPNEQTYFVFGVSEAGKFPLECCANLDRFTGSGNLLWPEWVVKEQEGNQMGSCVDGRETIGALRFLPCVLEPEQSISYFILFGTTETREKAVRLGEQWLNPERLCQSLEKTKQYWRGINQIRCVTANRNFDLNLQWIDVQPTLRRIYGCSFLPHHDYGRGGCGWRDLWQDSMGLLLHEPDEVGDLLAAYFGGVRLDGTNATIIGEHAGEFRADRNGIPRVWMDHGYWPVFTVWLYVQQTGDVAILLRQIPFFCDDMMRRGRERQEHPTTTNRRGTVVEHMLLQQLTAFCDAGEHGFLLLRNADWNDALDMAPTRGESVAFSAAYAGSMEQLAQLLTALSEKTQLKELHLPKRFAFLLDCEGNWSSVKSRIAQLEAFFKSIEDTPDEAEEVFPVFVLAMALRKRAAFLRELIQKTQWIETSFDDGWFNSYYDEYGKMLESGETGKERMMLTGQVFSILGGVASNAQVRSIWRAAVRLLYDASAGGFRLNTRLPEGQFQIGRMLAFAYGHKENGAVFSHMAVMFAYALYQHGFAREGYTVLSSLWKQTLDIQKSRIYPGIPEYFAPDGRGMYPYLTGAGAWTILCVVQQMFGLRGNMGALEFAPQLLPEQFDPQKNAEIWLNFGKRRFHVCYRMEKRLELGTYEIIRAELNGRELHEMRLTPEEISALQEGRIHRLKIWLGRKNERNH